MREFREFYRCSALVATLAISFGQKPEAFHWLLKGTGITTIIENEHANVFVCSTSRHMRCHMHPRCSVVGAHYLLSSSNTNFLECVARVASTLKLCIRFGVLSTALFCEPQNTQEIMASKNITNAIAAFGRRGLQLKSHPTWIVRACSLRGPRPVQSHRRRPTEFSKA